MAQKEPSTYRFCLSIGLMEQKACLSFPLLLFLRQQGLPTGTAVLQGREPEGEGRPGGSRASGQALHALPQAWGIMGSQPCHLHHLSFCFFTFWLTFWAIYWWSRPKFCFLAVPVRFSSRGWVVVVMVMG